MKKGISIFFILLNLIFPFGSFEGNATGENNTLTTSVVSVREENSNDLKTNVIKGKKKTKSDNKKVNKEKTLSNSTANVNVKLDDANKVAKKEGNESSLESEEINKKSNINEQKDKNDSSKNEIKGNKEKNKSMKESISDKWQEEFSKIYDNEKNKTKTIDLNLKNGSNIRVKVVTHKTGAKVDLDLPHSLIINSNSKNPNSDSVTSTTKKEPAKQKPGVLKKIGTFVLNLVSKVINGVVSIFPFILRHIF